MYKAMPQTCSIRRLVEMHKICRKPTKSVAFHIWKVTPFQCTLCQKHSWSAVSQLFDFGFLPSVSINTETLSDMSIALPDIQPGHNELVALCHTSVTTFHTWKVCRNFDVLHTEDFKASWTSYSKARCSLSRGITSRLCPPCIKTKHFDFAQSNIAIFASYMPSSLKLEYKFLPFYSHFCPVTHGMWGRMWQHLITTKRNYFNNFTQVSEDCSAILWGRV